MDRVRVDYERLAAGYHKRYEVDSLEGIGRALLELLPSGKKARVLEVGCGTGNWLSLLHEHARLIVGADASPAMLDASRAPRDRVPLVNALANGLPFRRGSFDLIYCVNAIHHFDDAFAYVRDGVELLAPGGIMAVIGIEPRIARVRYFYDYFERTRPLDLERFPSFGELVDAFLSAGVLDQSLRVAHTSSVSFHGEDVFSDPFMDKLSNSLLASLSDDEYQTGRQRIKEVIARTNGEIDFTSVLDFLMLTGRKRAG